MTKEQFESYYAEMSGIPVERLADMGYRAVPCDFRARRQGNPAATESRQAEALDRAKRCVILHLPQGLMPLFLERDHRGAILWCWRKTVPDNLRRIGFFYDHTEALHRHSWDHFSAEPRVILPESVEIVEFEESVSDFRIRVRHESFPHTEDGQPFPVWRFVLRLKPESRP